MRIMESKIQEEILNRAVQRSLLRQQEQERVLCTQEMIDALEEVTGLARAELEQIVDEVRASHFRNSDEGLLSIKHQIVFVSIFILVLLGIPILAVWLI